jgi:putative tricarboxylic transport membrane protein
MGPGYFPVLLSGTLIVFGIIIAGRGCLTTSAGGGFGAVPWRAIAMISLAIIVFASFLRELGLLPSVALSSFLAALSSRKIGLPTALATAASLACFCTVIFGFLLKLSIPILGSWFGG